MERGLVIDCMGNRKVLWGVGCSTRLIEKLDNRENQK